MFRHTCLVFHNLLAQALQQQVLREVESQAITVLVSLQYRDQTSVCMEDSPCSINICGDDVTSSALIPMKHTVYGYNETAASNPCIYDLFWPIAGVYSKLDSGQAFKVSGITSIGIVQ